jgi:hypothetical protein
MTVIAWPRCCAPVVAHGSDSRGHRFTVWLHGLACDRPPSERTTLVLRDTPVLTRRAA